MEEDYQQHSAGPSKKYGKQHNTLPIWGNESTMNLNALVLANIQGSSYFKVQLFKLKTYHEVVDEIYYQVKHMEPWERGSRKTSGQTGMCGGVRGVGAGGIVSTAFCLLYKLYTLKLTRKQVNGLLNHTDSPYIRALGFMYLRYTQPPADLYDWYEDYLQDEEEIDVKAGGGQIMTIGQMVYQFLTKLDWFSTLFPRIPVPIQKQIEKKIELYCREHRIGLNQFCAPRVMPATVPAISTSVRSSEYEEDGDDYNQQSTQRSSRSQGTTSRREYRNEHDDRDFYEAKRASRHRRDDSRSPNGDSEYRQRDKHKKKSKHKHRSRSRSRSRSRDRRRRERSARRKECERDRNPYSAREERERRY